MNGCKNTLIFNISEEILSLKHNFFLIKVYKRQNFYEHVFKITDTRDGYYYAYFSYREIKTLLGNKYREDLRFLEENGFIKINKDLIDRHGNYSIKISTGPVIKELQLKRVPRESLSKSKTGLDALRRSDTARNNMNNKVLTLEDTTVLKHLAETILATKIELTKAQFIRIYKQRYQESEKNITEEEYVEHGLNMWERLKELQKGNDWMEVMEYLSVSPFGKRVFHPMISFVKEVRAFITIGSEETISYDIKNSQLAFLAIMLKTQFKNNVLFAMIENDVDIYQLVADKKRISRKEAKAIIFKSIFGPKKGNFDKDLLELFGLKTLEEIEILKYNKPLNTNEIKTKTYGWLAFRLQMLESDFAIRHLGKILASNEIPFLPIHDEFIVPKQYNRHFYHALNLAFYELSPHMDLSKVIKLKETINNCPAFC